MSGSLPALRQSVHRATRFSAVMLAILGTVEAIVTRRFDAGVWLCAGMAVWLWILAHRYGKARNLKAVSRIARLNAGLCGLVIPLISSFSGGSRGMDFQLLIAVPLIFAIFVPVDAWPPIINGVASALAGGWVMVKDGRTPPEITVWLVLLLFMALFGAYGAKLYQRFINAELKVEGERADALARLAESEKQRLQAARLALVGQLAAGVAHEINNPLAFIKSNVQWIDTEWRRGALGSGGECAEELPQVLGEALVGINRIGQIVTDLKSFAHAGPPEVEPTVLADALDEALRMARVRLHGTVQVEAGLPPTLPPVLASPRQLIQVLLNLLVNAADALETLELEAPTAPRWVRIEASTLPDHVELSVSDSGPGIPDEIRGRLFEPFFTTKGPKKGTGLGLALSRELMQRMGGALELCPGPGTRFRIRIPRALPATTTEVA
jgi:signal transduction histidine kinase